MTLSKIQTFLEIIPSSNTMSSADFLKSINNISVVLALLVRLARHLGIRY